MALAKINGLNLYYEIHGKGQPLVLVAGFACDMLMWFPILDDLKAHFKLLIFDNRCVGRSDTIDKPFSIEDMARDVISLIKDVGFEKAHILGHSMGGCIVQAMAMQERSLFNKIIISNSFIRMNASTSMYQKFIFKLRESNYPVEEIAKGLLPWLLSDTFLENPKNVEAFIQGLVNPPFPQSLIGFKRQLEALLNFDSTNWYKNIQGPALIIGADEDILYPHDSERLVNGIKEAKFIEFRRLRHLPFVEKPKEFVAIVSNYLK